MTQTADPPNQASSASRTVEDPRPRPRSDPDTSLAPICPYLLADAGSWRSARPDKAHRCAAVEPPTVLAPEKQRRLCLSVDHESCATFLAAAEARDSLMPPNRVGIDETLVRPYPRMAPVLLDDRRVAALPDIARRQGLGQLGLVLLIGIASAAILLARLPGAGQGPGQALPGGAAAPSPAGAPVVTASGREAESSLSASADTGNSARPSPSTTSAVQSPEPTPSAAASQGGRTYRVRPGDTLARIAGRFGTSAKAIMVRNGISDPRRIQIGAVLVIP